MEDFRRAYAAGHELGHGHHQYPRTSIDSTAFVAELRQSLRLLGELLGQAPQMFSYPFNSYLPGDDELGRPHVQQLVNVDGAMINAATAPLALPRFTWPGPHRNAGRQRRLWTGGM